MNTSSSNITVISFVSTVASLYLAIILFFSEYEMFSTYSSNAYITILIALSISCCSIFPFLFTYHWLFAVLATLTLQGGALIVIFAAIYRGHGLEAITENDLITHTPTALGHEIMIYTPSAPETAIYFSIVTWTTLGYGDFQPPEDLRLIAAFEALIGYLYLGLFVTLMGAMLLRKSAAKE